MWYYPSLFDGIKFLQEILPILFSTSALVISYFTFSRQRTLENENIIFKYKLEKYHAILSHIVQIYIYIDKKADEYEDAIENKLEIEVIENISDAVFNEISVFQMKIYADGALLPKDVLKAIIDFNDKLGDLDLFPVDKFDSFEKTMSMLGISESLVDKIEIAMRQDLHLETLNSSLHSRLSSKRKNNTPRNKNLQSSH